MVQTIRYTGRRPDKIVHEKIILLRIKGESISDTAHLVGCSESTVKRVWQQKRPQKRDYRFTTKQSEHTLAIIDIYISATDYFGDKEQAME